MKGDIVMKKLFRIIALVVLNLATLPVQIGLALALLTSELIEDELADINEFWEEANQSNKTWIKTGRFPE